MFSSNNGIIFENNVHKQLKKTKYPVYNELEVMNMFGNHITGIDHMIILDNMCICIQDKYCKVPINITNTSHFTQTVNIISQIINRPCIGIYLSYDKFVGQNNKAFFPNNQMIMNNFIAIYGNTEKNLISNLMEYLYSINIYMYESDGDCIMLS